MTAKLLPLMKLVTYISILYTSVLQVVNLKIAVRPASKRNKWTIVSLFLS